MKLIAALATVLAAATTIFATLGQAGSRHESSAATVSAAEIAKPRPLRHNRHVTKRLSQRRTSAAQKLRIRKARRVAQLLAARRVVRAHPGRTVLHRLAKPSGSTTKPKQPAAAVPTPTSPQDALTAPNDPAWPQEWSLAQIRALQAWKLGTSSHPVLIAVVDSGVDSTQPDLQGAVAAGYNAIDGSADTSDTFGHGTMVAGVIAARAGNGIGVTGICAACSIMPVKVLDSSGTGTAASMASGIRWAAEHGANIINLSLVLSGDDPGVRDAIAYANARGVLVVAAAGNASNDTQTFPASYPGVLSVAATDSNDHAYSWTTFGPWVAVAAPGCSMSTAIGGTFAEFCGTSAAAPLVAGLAGLAMSTGRPTAADAGAALQRTARPLPGIASAGRVDALTLLQQFS